MPPVLTKNGDSLELDLASCRGGEFQDSLMKIKEVPGRRWNPQAKVWSVPAEPDVAERVLKTILPEVDQEFMDWLIDSKTQREQALLAEMPADGELLIPWATQRCEWQPEVVNGEPFDGLLPYQRAGVDMMVSGDARAILGDDMGLGKTLQAITAVEEWVERNVFPDGDTRWVGPKLVIAPNSVKGGWKREIERWLPEGTPVYIINGASPAKRRKQLDEAIAEDAWVIVNWEQLRVKKEKVKLRNGGQKTVTVMKEPLFEETEWLAVIADEVHKAKNRKSQQTQGLWRCQGKVMFGLTGTALMNSPDELWSILRWLWPDEFHERGSAHKPGAMAFWTFYEMYVDYWEDHFNRKVVTGVKNADGLRYLLTGKLIRRTAKILGLKGRKRIFFPIDLNPTQRKLYDEAATAMWLDIQQAAEEGDAEAKSIIQRLADGEEIDANDLLQIKNGASRMVRCQQIIESPALLGGPDDSSILDDIEEKVEAAGDNQWVVFTQYKGTCNLLKARLEKQGKKVAVYNGDVDPEERTEIEDAFQRGEIDVIVGTIAAMYQGITLTASHLMYFVSRDFVPDVNEQAESREDRLGQQELVRVYVPVASDTVAASRVQPINRLKESIVRSVLAKDTIQEVHHS